jgi:hypothetical protein
MKHSDGSRGTEKAFTQQVNACNCAAVEKLFVSQ